MKVKLLRKARKKTNDFWLSRSMWVAILRFIAGKNVDEIKRNEILTYARKRWSYAKWMRITTWINLLK